MINNGPGAAASTPQTTYWEALTTELAEIDADLNRKLGELGAAWEGAAGESATAGLTPLQAWATDAQSGTNMMKSSTEYQADMISRARAEMPEPVEVTTPAPSGWAKVAAGAALLTGNAGPAASVAGQAMDHEQQEAQQDQASQKAVDTMDSYQNSSEFNRNTLGTFVPPPDVVVATPEPSGGSGSAVGNFNNNYPGNTGNGNYTAPSGYSGAPGTGSGYVTPAGTGGGHYVGPPSGTPTVPSGYVPPTGTTPSGYIPPTTNPGGPPAPNQYLPSGPNGPNPSFTGNLPPTSNPSSPNSTNNPGAGKSATGGPGAKGGVGQAGLGQAGDASRQAGQMGKGGMAGGFGQA
ncbi:MAG: PPE domain-containing protein, partial [Actinokineospora sp.]